MKKKLRIILAIGALCACISGTALANSVPFTAIILKPYSQEPYTTDPATKTNTAYSDAVFSIIYYYNQSPTLPLTIRVRAGSTGTGPVASASHGIYGPGTYYVPYTGGYGAYGSVFVGRLATNSGASGYAVVTGVFTP